MRKFADEKSGDKSEMFLLEYKCGFNELALTPGVTRLIATWKGCKKKIVFPKCGGEIQADDCTTCMVTFIHDGVSIIYICIYSVCLFICIQSSHRILVGFSSAIFLNYSKFYVPGK